MGAAPISRGNEDDMPRPLQQIIAHIRAVAGNPAVNTTLIQTEDLLALCDVAERTDALERQNNDEESS